VVYEPQARLRLPEACQNQIYAADQKKMQEDIAYIRSHWSSLFLQGDPYYNPAFSRERADYSL
jgi:hypothetical protein